MQVPYVIVGMKDATGRLGRFLPLLSWEEWALVSARDGLPTDWRFWRSDLDPDAAIGDLPVIFDTVGPIDPLPMLRAWKASGMLPWKTHRDIEAATEVANALAVRHGVTALDAPTASYSAAGDDAAARLHAFVQLWQEYELACANVLWLEDCHLAHRGPWDMAKERRSRWASYRRSVTALEEVCQWLVCSSNTPVVTRDGPPVYLNE